MKYTKDYYQILGIKPSATSTEIRRAYRRLAILYHPDRNPIPQSNAKMQEINEAYSVLGNHDKRAAYDFDYLNRAVDAQTKIPYPFHEKEPSLRPRRSYIFGSILLFSLFISLMVVVRFLGDTTAFATFLIAVTALSILIIAFLAFWRLLTEEEADPQCPHCKKATGEKMRDELVGIFRKRVPPLNEDNGRSKGRMLLHEKYKIHYRCRSCGYEWVTFQVNQIEETPFI